MYRVIVTRRALKDLKNIDKEMQYRIATKLKEYVNLNNSPRALGMNLKVNPDEV